MSLHSLGRRLETALVRIPASPGARADALTPKQVEGIAAAIPAQKFGVPDDIAATAVYLASDEAGYVTGETIHVNGGMVMV